MTKSQKLRFSLFFAAGLIALSVILRNGFEHYYATPRQIIYERHNAQLRSDYVALNTKLQTVESHLSDLRERDDRFYRSILNLDPVPSSIREAGTGGAETHMQMSSVRESGMIRNVSQRIDQISNKVMIQSNSLEDVYQEAVSNQRFLACRPSIHPISSADPYWLTSSYGYRIDPFTKRRTAHHGIDLAGPYGLNIHATGDGVVVLSRNGRYGYGKEVKIDHGFGFITRYAHLQDINVKVGQKVNRGEVIGTLGSSGRSTGPHLHYEVISNGRPANPYYYFFENLNPEEYELLAARAN